MNEEDRLNAGVLFYAEALELVKKKSRAHILNIEYNMTFESDAEKKKEIISSIIGEFGEDGVLQEPIFFHYGVHTKKQDGTSSQTSTSSYRTMPR